MFRLLVKRLKHITPATKAVMTFAIVTLGAFVLPVRKSPINVVNVLGAASIFYSVLLGFYVSAAMTNLSRLKTLVATETGALMAIYYMVKLSLPDRAEATREAIDHYLIKRFDYEVDEYVEPTNKEYFAIFDVLKGAKTKSNGDEAAMTYVAEAMYYVSQARREITIVGAEIVSGSSWLVLNVLSLIIVFSLFLMRDGSWESALVTALLSASAILALFILGDVDGNRFGEEQFALDTYQDVFTAIDKPHYYPTIYLEAGRYRPTVKEYRTGTSIKNHFVRKGRSVSSTE